MASQELSSLIVQKQEFQAIWREQKQCVIFHHENFGGPLVWALQCYVSVDIEGAEDMLFVEAPPAATTVPVADGDGVDGGQGGRNNNDNNNENNKQEILPDIVQEMMECGGNNMDIDDVDVAAHSLPMVDNDNEPAPENEPVADGALAHDIFSGWGHSGLCYRKSLVQGNAVPRLTFWTSDECEPSNLQLFESFFFTTFVKPTIIPKTNKKWLDKNPSLLVSFCAFLDCGF